MKDAFEFIHSLMKEKKFNDVITLLSKNQETSIRSPYDSDLNHAWYLLGDIYYKQQKYEDAVSAFKKCLIDRPDDIEAILALANCYFALELPEKAEIVLKEGKKVEPLNPKIIYSLANSLFDQEKYRESINLYEEVDFKDHEIYDLAKKNMLLAKRLLSAKQ